MAGFLAQLTGKSGRGAYSRAPGPRSGAGRRAAQAAFFVALNPLAARFFRTLGATYAGRSDQARANWAGGCDDSNRHAGGIRVDRRHRAGWSGRARETSGRLHPQLPPLLIGWLLSRGQRHPTPNHRSGGQLRRLVSRRPSGPISPASPPRAGHITYDFAVLKITRIQQP